ATCSARAPDRADSNHTRAARALAAALVSGTAPAPARSSARPHSSGPATAPTLRAAVANEPPSVAAPSACAMTRAMRTLPTPNDSAPKSAVSSQIATPSVDPGTIASHPTTSSGVPRPTAVRPYQPAGRRDAAERPDAEGRQQTRRECLGQPGTRGRQHREEGQGAEGRAVDEDGERERDLQPRAPQHG